jgi:hypothetical protein
VQGDEKFVKTFTLKKRYINSRILQAATPTWLVLDPNNFNTFIFLLHSMLTARGIQAVKLQSSACQSVQAAN